MKLLGLIFLVILIMACGADEIPPPITLATVTVGEPTIEISSTALYGAFEANEVAYEDKYKDRYILVYGDIRSIEITRTKLDVKLKGGDFLGDIVCKVDKDNPIQRQAIISLQVGDSVTIHGEAQSMGYADIELKNCTIVLPEDISTPKETSSESTLTTVTMSIPDGPSTSVDASSTIGFLDTSSPSVAERETVLPSSLDEIEISTFTPEREAVIPPASGEVQISTLAPEPETVVPSAPDEIEISISAPELYTAYDLNPVNADREYTQKIASITGQVAAIANEDGKYLVKLFGGALGASAISIGITDFIMIMETIICQVDKGDEHSVDRIASVNVGSHVTIVGWIEGMVSRNIQITNCNIQ